MLCVYIVDPAGDDGGYMLCVYIVDPAGDDGGVHVLCLYCRPWLR